MTAPASDATTAARTLIRQGWASIALWMTLGLLLEGMLGYKIPAYLNDPQRRELFRLAHAHGTLLGVLLIAGGLCIRGGVIELQRIAAGALRLGAIMMPVGFAVAGIWHPEGDPGIAIWLVPPGAVLVIFAAISAALASRPSRTR